MFDNSIQRIAISDAQPTQTSFRIREPVCDARRAPADAEPDLYELGYTAGNAAAAEQFVSERAALQAMVASAAALQSEPSEELAALIAHTVVKLVRHIVGNVETDQEWLTQSAMAATALVSECDAARTLFVHPDDRALLDGVDIPLAIASDAILARGSLRIDCSKGWIETGTAHQLDLLDHMLFGVPLR